MTLHRGFRRRSIALLATLILSAVLAVPAVESSTDSKIAPARDGSADALFLSPLPPQAKTESLSANGSGPFAAMVPSFVLRDPLGFVHTNDRLCRKNGMLIMLTVPNLTQFEKQKRWERWLRKEAWPEQNAPRCVVLEDLSQQDSYKEKIRKLMTERFQQDPSILFLVDEVGDVRRSFGVELNETVILLADSSGRIIHHERDDIEPDRESAKRVITEIQKLAESRRLAAALKPKNTLVAVNVAAVNKNP